MPREGLGGLLLVVILVNTEVLVGAGLASLNIVQHQKLQVESGEEQLPFTLVQYYTRRKKQFPQ